MKNLLFLLLSLTFLLTGCVHDGSIKNSQISIIPANKEIRGVYTKGYKALDIQKSNACPNGKCPGLGNGFYLPETNALSNFSGGAIFFTNKKVGECATVSSSQTSSRGISELNSMKNFIETMMVSADLSGSYKTAALTMHGTASAMTGSSSNITTTFHSTILDISVAINSIDFNQNSKCFSKKNLDAKFLKKFEALALIDKTTVYSSASWTPYVNFLKNYGSHIMMQQQIGSRFQQWESSTSKASDIQKMLDAKACAKVEGISAGGGWSAKGCAVYSEKEKRKALQTNSFSKRIIEGGTKKARTKLTQDVTKETLDAFIASAGNSNEAIRFIFKPIWRLLISIYSAPCAKDGKGSINCGYLQRAYNLQAAYEGWTAVGCPKKINGYNSRIQSMIISGKTSLGINTYACNIVKTGCQSNRSCHLGGAGSVCYCYGPDCIVQGDRISGMKNNVYRDKVRGNKTGSWSKGVNKSCYYKFIAHCNCDTSWAGGLPSRNVYLQSAP